MQKSHSNLITSAKNQYLPRTVICLYVCIYIYIYSILYYRLPLSQYYRLIEGGRLFDLILKKSGENQASLAITAFARCACIIVHHFLL